MAASSVAEDAGMATGVKTDVRRLILAMSGIVFLIALAFLTPRILYALSHVTTDDAYVDAYAAVVSARVPGAVVSIPVQEGERVKRGQVLARLDDTDARSQVLTATESLLSAQAALAQARYDARSQAALHDSQTMRANALESQAGDLTHSLQLSAQSSQAAAAAARESIAEAAAAMNAANAQVPAAKTRMRNAQSNLDRMRKLAAQGFISQTQVEAAQNDFAQAQATLRASVASAAQARATVASVRAKAKADELQSDQAQTSARAQAWGETLAQSDAMANSGDALAAKKAAVAAAQAQVSAARQSLDLAKYKLSETVLRSPVDGYVADRAASVGEALQSGDPAVVVMPSGGLYVTANLKETQFDRIRDGARADVHIDAFPGVKFYGHVQALGAASQSALSIAPETRVTANFVKITQRVPVRVVIDRSSASQEPVLRPGMSAEVSIAN